ncbi:MAG: hypothetical protein WBB01_21400 [Phormidesmis sp.]
MTLSDTLDSEASNVEMAAPDVEMVAPDVETSEESRIQLRLNSSSEQDRVFLEVLRRRRSTPSRLRQKLDKKQVYRRWRYAAAIAFASLSIGASTWVALFMSGRTTLGGVPYSIVNKFWQDEAAKTAYFGGDRQALHDRLSELDVEADIKDYYRSRFSDEDELDRYIHQIMFDRTGYVGEAYKVDNYGRLSWKGY